MNNTLNLNVFKDGETGTKIIVKEVNIMEDENLTMGVEMLMFRVTIKFTHPGTVCPNFT